MRSTILADEGNLPICHEGNLPAVVHCTHGKDRTGLLVALLLLMLGVDEAAVVQDYVLSEEELKVGFRAGQKPGQRPTLRRSLKGPRRAAGRAAIAELWAWRRRQSCNISRG